MGNLNENSKLTLGVMASLIAGFAAFFVYIISEITERDEHVEARIIAQIDALRTRQNEKYDGMSDRIDDLTRRTQLQSDRYNERLLSLSNDTRSNREAVTAWRERAIEKYAETTDRLNRLVARHEELSKAVIKAHSEPELVGAK